MYVDVGENQPFLEKLPFAFVSLLTECAINYNISFQKLNEVDEVPFKSCTTGNSNKSAAKALTGVTNEYFGTIRDWIEWFFQNESEV